MNRSFWFIIVIVSFAVASCTPIGTIHDSDPGADVDDFWTVPQRQYYTLGDNFVRDKDMRAFASSQGMIESIPADSVEINLVKYPDAAEPGEPIHIDNGKYRLVWAIVGTGRKQVIVSYGSKTAEYSIEIRNPDGSTDPLEPGNGEGSGISITWRE